MNIKLKLRDILDKRHMTQRELSVLSGVPQATLSDLVHDKRTSINKQHLSAIAEALNIKRIDELIDFETTNNIKGGVKHGTSRAE